MDVGFFEVVMLAILALLIFGPERLPDVARTVGRVVGRVRREAASTFDTLRAEVDFDELTSFNDDLQRERRELQSRARIDARSLQVRSDGRRGAAPGAEEGTAPRFDPHAT